MRNLEKALRTIKEQYPENYNNGKMTLGILADLWPNDKIMRKKLEYVVSLKEYSRLISCTSENAEMEIKRVATRLKEDCLLDAATALEICEDIVQSADINVSKQDANVSPPKPSIKTAPVVQEDEIKPIIEKVADAVKAEDKEKTRKEILRLHRKRRTLYVLFIFLKCTRFFFCAFTAYGVISIEPWALVKKIVWAILCLIWAIIEINEWKRTTSFTESVSDADKRLCKIETMSEAERIEVFSEVNAENRKVLSDLSSLWIFILEIALTISPLTLWNQADYIGWLQIFFPIPVAVIRHCIGKIDRDEKELLTLVLVSTQS